MRLDWFLPFVRKTKPGTVRKPPGVLVRAVSHLVPAKWLTHESRRGPIRRFLKRLGPSWSSSPFRRIVQAACLVIFLVLFFYVCFPYTAKPSRIWHGWVPMDVNSESGAVKVEAQHPPADKLAAGAIITVTDAAPAGSTDAPPILGQFRITSISGSSLSLAPAKPLSAAEIEKLSFSVGPWALHEKSPADWPDHYAEDLSRKEKVAAESFLAIDPLVSISTAVAGRTWVWSLTWAGVLLLVCVVIPRGFCGYICPLGTLIDLFDWLVGKRVTKFRVSDEGWWVHIKYYLLLAVMIAAMFGVLISGFVAAIPVITRGVLVTLKPFHDAAARGWHNVPPVTAGQVVSIVLFFVVLGLGLFKPRFWCKYVCPSGAVFSVFNLFRASERKVEDTCIHCNKCVEICPFDAIKPDFTTRTTDCTLCQSCGGVCPTDAIKFVGRTNRISLKVVNDPPTRETPLGRRGFLAAGVGLAGALTAGAASALGIRTSTSFLPVRPPGSVPEEQFLQLCIRCGECFRACPNDVLQPLGLQQGLNGLWTPYVKADWAGCEVSCNNCGQVCPTGAILPIPLEVKKKTRMGLAIVNEKTCLPYAQKEACQLCVDECNAAGYHAIDFVRAGTKADENGNPIEDTGFLAPVVNPDKCTGCGLCQTRCYAINVAEKNLLAESAIIIEAGQGREDRLTWGQRKV